MSRWETGAIYLDVSTIPALADVLQVAIAVLFSRTPKADVLFKEDQIDYKTITKFKILSGVVAALIFFSSGFGFSLRFVADNSGPYVALVIAMAVFAFGGVILGGSSLTWFRSFCKGKFYNDLYCKDYYGALVILAASLLPLIYSVAMKNYGNEATGENIIYAARRCPPLRFYWRFFLGARKATCFLCGIPRPSFSWFWG